MAKPCSNSICIVAMLIHVINTQTWLIPGLLKCTRTTFLDWPELGDSLGPFSVCWIHLPELFSIQQYIFFCKHTMRFSEAWRSLCSAIQTTHSTNGLATLIPTHWTVTATISILVIFVRHGLAKCGNIDFYSPASSKVCIIVSVALWPRLSPGKIVLRE